MFDRWGRRTICHVLDREACLEVEDGGIVSEGTFLWGDST